MKKTKLRLLLLLFFIGGLIILPQKANADEVEAVPVSISVKYGQTEARTILDMINEARTNSEHAWYWNKDDTTKTFCTDLKELEYDYDLERVAMKRAAEIALSYDHERPIGGYAWDTYGQENIRYSHAGENIAAAQTTASQVNFCWREDNEPYGGQGHRRNMLSSKFNCVGIGHVYYNGVHYWVEEFAYRPEINTTEVPANDSTQAVSVSVDKTKIKKVDVTFDQDAYSLRIGENTTPVIKETRIGVEYFWSGGRGFAPVLDTPVVSIGDSSVASYSNKTLSGLKEGTTELTATLYGVTSSTSPPVSVHDCKNHWDTGSITKKPTCTEPGEKTYHCTYEENGICKATKTEAVKKLGHKYILTKRDAPTCESDGVLYGKCSRCSKTITKQDAKNPALGHDWTDNGDGTATCGREGCGKNHTHDLDSGTTTVAPTCTTTGEKKYCCAYTNCPYKKTESLKATGHKNKETRNYKKPTCKYEGYTGDTYCKDCGTLLSSGKPTKKFDHDWNSGTVTKKATCKEEGSVTYTCENCGETETVSTKKTKHDYREEQHKNATCTENGYSISVCQVCNDKKKEEIVAKGHSKGIRNKATATCKAEGQTGDTYCRTCKTLLEEGKILPKLEHQWNDGTVTKRATYETAGELTYRCRKCAAKRIISIEKLAYPKVGTSYTISGNEYKISKPGAEVILVKTSKTTKNVTVPAQIYVQGITYKVISIGAKAFNNNKNLTKVTIGTNIIKINSNAFFNCKNLKTVTIKSVLLTTKTASKKAFKNAHKKLVIQVPKKVKRFIRRFLKG